MQCAAIQRSRESLLAAASTRWKRPSRMSACSCGKVGAGIVPWMPDPAIFWQQYRGHIAIGIVIAAAFYLLGLLTAHL
jgi:hypothetical protein